MKRWIQPQSSIELKLRIPWDSNTAKGFTAALVLVGLLLLLSWKMPIPSHPPRAVHYEVLATVNFGLGDGSGGSKGNLSPEGLRRQALQTSPALVDAATPAARSATKKRRKTPSAEGGKIVPIAGKQESKAPSKDTLHGDAKHGTGSAEKLAGDREGSSSATGRGSSGTGTGSGLGFGEIDWGGGGGAIVVKKVIPTAPEGLSRSTIVKLRFVVSPQGEVIDVRPIVRGIPEAENAAIRALRQWRFRPFSSDSPVIGLITFRFDVN
ncbi:MAG: energy transducer TonB [Chlorobi bacterium]|nr:energy transducer TonB [Chlorobiota bacterium]